MKEKLFSIEGTIKVKGRTLTEDELSDMLIEFMEQNDLEFSGCIKEIDD